LQIHDYLVTELGFASGSSAVLEVSRGERPRSASLLEITVVGTEGVILRDWDADGILAWFDQSFQSWSPNGAGDRTFSRELASFVSAASDPSLVNPPVADAVHVVELGVASELSLAAGETVQIGAVA
jgi:predicted dehydrogenase